jgi:CRISPR-associated protein Csd1
MLQLLYEYAESRNLVAKPGYTTMDVHWLINFTSNGDYASLTKLGEKSSGQRIPNCPQFSLAELKAMGTGSRHFLVDSLDVVALLPPKKDEAPDDKQTAKHAGFVGLLLRAESVDERIGRIARGLEKSIDRIRDELLEQKAKATQKATFAIQSSNDAIWIVNQKTWQSWYEGIRGEVSAKRSSKNTKKKASAGNPMRCLLTGELVDAVSTHDKIKGLSDVGGHKTGGILASFKQGAFQHFGLAQAANAAMSEQAMSLYVTALNKLIRQAVKVGNRKVVYWYLDGSHGAVEPVQDPFSFLFRSTASDPESIDNALATEVVNNDSPVPSNRYRIQAEKSAHSLLGRFESGGERELLKEGRFIAITLSANTTRVVVRDIRQGRFEDLVKAIDDFDSDLRVCDFGGGYAKTPGLDRLATATLREKKPEDDFENWISPASTTYTSLWQAALSVGNPSSSRENISLAVAMKALNRLRLAMLNGEVADALDSSSKTMPRRRSAYYARLSLLKLYLLRDTENGDPEMKPYLNENSTNPAYHAGRLLAVFQHIQSLQSGEPKASFLDRYYASASTSPFQILPRIFTVARTHLKRIKQKTLQSDLHELLAEIHSRIQLGSEKTPTQLSPTDQFQFQLGFFQQQPYLPIPETARRVKTIKGYLVRSKSEAIIAELLHRVVDAMTELGATISYEPSSVQIGGVRLGLKPDWYVQTNQGTRALFVEHLGMMDVPKYATRAVAKLDEYRSNGVLEVTDTDIDTQSLTKATALLVTSEESDVADLSAFESRFRLALKHL